MLARLMQPIMSILFLLLYGYELLILVRIDFEKFFNANMQIVGYDISYI